jgi:DNA-binding transcriptional LysR family regulator
MSAAMEWDEQRLGRHLKLRDLNVLLTVARCGSMGKAAAQLCVSQPAISKTIADMEYALGVRLLDRGPQGVEPTIYARALLDRGLVAFDELKQAMKHIEFLADPTVGELRIGANPVLAAGLVAAVIDQLSRQYPRIVFHLLEADPAMTYRALEQRKVDVAVVHINVPIAEERMHADVLYDEPHVVVAAARNPWTRRSGIQLTDLINEPWTLPPPDSPFGTVIAEAFRASGLDFPRTAVFVNTAAARNALVSSGRFLSIVSYSMSTFRMNHPVLKRLPIDLPAMRIPVGILTLKNRTLGPVAQLFIECAHSVAKSIASWPQSRKG